MADELIKRKDLRKKIDQIELEDWIKAAEDHDLQVTQPTGGSSHYAIRKKEFPPEDFRGFITVVYKKMYKQDKVKIFKRLREAGIEEDSLWKSLGLL